MCTRFFLCICVLLFFSQLPAQTKKIDSLKIIVDAATANDEKLFAIVTYLEDYSNVNHDSLDKYAYIALDLASTTKDERLKSLAQLTLAQDYIQWGWTDSALEVVNKELPNNKLEDDKRRDIYFRLKRLRSVAYGADGKVQEALEGLYPLADECLKYKDSVNYIITCNTIGSGLLYLKDFQNSYIWNNKALAFCIRNNQKLLGSPYISRGQLMYYDDNTDSAIYYLKEGLEYCKQIESYDRIASGYRILSAVYSDDGQLGKAEDALKQMQFYRRKAHTTPDAIIEDNIQIADFYANTGQLKKAIAFCWSKLETGNLIKKQGEEAKTFNNDPSVRLPFYEALARYLKEDKDYSEYQKVLEEIIVLKDTVYERNKAEAIAEMQTKYDVEQKENTIVTQQLKLTQRNYFLYGTVIFIAMATAITFLLWRNQRNKQKMQLQKAIEDEKNIAAQSILDAEEKERKRIAADLHDNIGAYATAISADVESITGKGFPGNEDKLQSLQQHSKEIIYSLRDTIWVLNKDNITITGISDRIKNYINKLMPTYEHLNISVEENIQNDVRVGSQKALNIFRIVQEAVHNALKHSNAQNIIIKIDSAEKINISVIDNGKGISARITNEGNGLRNMKTRAADGGIQLNVESSEDKGTAILMQATTN